MPLDKYFKGRGRQVMDKLKSAHGEKAGEREFYATANARGLNPSDNDGDEAPAKPRPPMSAFASRLAKRER
jgi:hypothetical protein